MTQNESQLVIGLQEANFLSVPRIVPTTNYDNNGRFALNYSGQKIAL